MNLSEEQQKAIEVGLSNDLFLTAGAGSGKTTTLSQMVKCILDRNLASPDEILVLTFTNKAAGEMKNKIFKTVNHSNIKDMSIGTFHSIFNSVLQEFGKNINLGQYKFLEDREKKEKIEEILTELQVEFNDTDIYNYIEFIDKQKNFLITPTRLYKSIIKKKEATGRINPKDLLNYKVYIGCNKYFWNERKLDFSDILYYSYKLLKTNSNVRELFQNQYRYIIIDEAQDVNPVQIWIISAIKSKNNNVICIGDARQTIYRFRGSRSAFMIEHDKYFKNSLMMHLTNNYRSKANIVDIANNLIRNSKDEMLQKFNKDMNAANGKGNDVILTKYNTSMDEAVGICQKIIEMCKSNESRYGDIAILSSKNAVQNEIAEELKKNNIPFVRASDKSFWNSDEVKRITSFFMLYDAPNLEDCFYSIFQNVSISKKNIASMIKFADDNNINYIQALKRYDDEESEFERNQLLDALKFCGKYDSFTAIKKIIKKFSIIEEYKNSNSKNAAKAIDNIKRLFSFMKKNIHEYNDLETFVDYINSKTDLDIIGDVNAVNLLSIHSAKGLEFKTVFVTALENGILPDWRSNTKDEIEEDRRLLYVAITRAMDNLFLSYTRKRKYKKEYKTSVRSMLIDDLGSNLLEVKYNNDRKEI